MPTMADRITEHGITMKTRLGAPPNPEFTEAQGHTIVLTNTGGRKLATPFYMGSAHGLTPPTIENVLETLCQDAASIENAPAFEDWCDELGMDTDSRRAERIYNLSVSATEALRDFLGDAFKAFVFETEEEA